MKPLVQKILEAGLVDKHAAKMFEQWGQLESGASDMIGRKELTEKTLAEFAEDIEALLEAETDQVRETQLEAHVKEPRNFYCPNIGYYFVAAEDTMGNLLVTDQQKQELLVVGSFQRGFLILDASTNPSTVRTIVDIENVFLSNRVVALRLRLG